MITRRFRPVREVGLLLVFAAVMAGLSISVEHFATDRNLFQVLRSQAHLAVLACGMCLVILTGGIDLSVGSAVALSGVALGLAWQATGSAAAAAAAALLTGAACGLLNGTLIAFGRVPALIVTLATLSVFRGVAYAAGGSSTVGGFSPGLLAWSRADFAGLPVPVWITLALFGGLGLYLSRTDGGRAIYAVGANAAAASLSGVPEALLRLRLYLASGLLAGLAAVLYAARTNSVRADIGAEYELAAITIVVLGGTSVSGGEGSMLGTALGYLTLVFLQNGLYLGSGRFGLPLEFQGVVVAILLVGALLLDAGFRRRALARI